MIKFVDLVPGDILFTNMWLRLILANVALPHEGDDRIRVIWYLCENFGIDNFAYSVSDKTINTATLWRFDEIR